MPQVVSLQSYIETRLQEMETRNSQRFDAQEKAVAAALAAAEKAVTKAELASEKRFDAVNEFRQTLSDQASKFITRSEFIGFIFGLIGATAAIWSVFHR